MTREKPNTPHRRVITDLSFPRGFSINAGICKDKYLDTSFLLKLPTIDTITNQIKTLGKGCNSNSPLFQYKVFNQWVPLTDTKVRRHFNSILKRLNLHNNNITFHTFRCSGATFAFNSNVQLQEILSHGTWTSDCIWSYITLDQESGLRLSCLI